MNIKSIFPHQSLQPYIKRFWYGNVLSGDDRIAQYRILAAGSTGIIIQHQNEQSILYNLEDNRQLPLAFIYGQKTNHPCLNYFSQQGFILGIDFYPSAFKKFFGMNTLELTNTLIDAEELIPYTILQTVISQQNITAKIDLLQQYFCSLLARKQVDTSIVDHSLFLLQQDIVSVDSTHIAKILKLSVRHLQRKFKEDIGLSIENYKRILKFQYVMQDLRANQFDKLSDIAYKWGYADQSHFGREFKYFTGSTPKEFLQSSVYIDKAMQTQHALRIVGIK